MKKLLKVFLLLSTIFLYIQTLFWCWELASTRYAVSDYSEFIHIVEVIRSAKRQTKFLHGNSLIQYGLYDKQEVLIDSGRECAIGDFCAFNCLDPKCINDSVDGFVKKVKDRKDGCYYFIGNTDQWKEDGLAYESWDSHLYGWLCPGEVEIMGRVEVISH